MPEACDAIADHVFIVRCWNENLGQPQARAIWRIRVSALISGEDRHFADTNALARFIDDCLTAAHPPPEPH